jgi:AraC-like DNA-binding protein
VATPRLTGVLYRYQTHILYLGALIASARHVHHAGQVLWVPDGLVLERAGGLARRASTHVVPPGTPHGHGAAAAAAVLWVDADDLSWARAACEARDVPDALRTTLGAGLGAAQSREQARAIAQALLDLIAPPGDMQARVPRHPAVVRMCALLETGASERELSVTQLARQSGLSLRQLRQRFSEELGINPRSYLRWRRLRHAVEAIERGATLTEAAVQAGFADGAHFSRVFHAQFGMSPSQALAAMHFGGALV